MKLGPLWMGLEALATAHGATLLVPLIDRAALVGLVEADMRSRSTTGPGSSALVCRQESITP